MAGSNHKAQGGKELISRGFDLTKLNTTGDISSEIRNKPVPRQGTRIFDDGSFFAFLDREYIDNVDLPEGHQSSLSRVIYAMGGIIFLVGALESFTVPQLIGKSALSHLSLSGIGLLTAFIVGMVFVGFGKGVELIVHRRHKPLPSGEDASNN